MKTPKPFKYLYVQIGMWSSIRRLSSLTQMTKVEKSKLKHGIAGLYCAEDSKLIPMTINRLGNFKKVI